MVCCGPPGADIVNTLPSDPCSPGRPIKPFQEGTPAGGGGVMIFLESALRITDRLAHIHSSEREALTG